MSPTLLSASSGRSSSVPPLTVGVLALQGGFHEHASHLQLAASALSLPLSIIFVRTPSELAQCDGLVIPGGESSTITLLAHKSGLIAPLREFVHGKQKKPVYGTCAGAIVLSEEIYVDDTMKQRDAKEKIVRDGMEDGRSIGGVSLSIVRNQYGRQLASFEHPLEFSGLRDPSTPFPGVFIRAPIVHHLLSDPAEPISVLSSVPIECLPTSRSGTPALGPDANIVALKQGDNKLVTTFHPELSDDTRIHEWFLEKMLVPYKLGQKTED